MSISNSIRKQVYNKYNHRCAYCGRYLKLKEMTIDHIKPRSNGGNNLLSNLNPSCEYCNMLKEDNSLKIFKRRLNKIMVVAPYYVNKVWNNEFYFERFKK